MTAGRRFKRLVRERAARTGESYMAARPALDKPSEDGMDSAGLVEVELEGVRDMVDAGATRVLAFKERDGERHLTVCIGHQEAAAIAFALQGVPATRPMTHDVLRQLVDSLEGQVVRIVIGHLPETSTYTADVAVALAGGEERHFDWRVSDSVALAVRCDPRPSILVPPALLGEGPSPHD